MEEPDELAIPPEPCLTYVTHQASFSARQCKDRGKRLTARALLQACEKTLWGFVMEAAQDLACDDYAASVLPGMNVVHPYDVVFVEQVLYGCCRYTKLLSVLVSKLLKCKAAFTQPQDGFLYTVLGYLILIRLEELTFPNLRRLILSQNAQKLLPFVEFIFDTGYLNQHCKPEWLKIFDIEFVEELVDNISSWSTEASDLENSIAERVYIKDLRDGRRTIPQPFNLSVSSRAKPQPKEEEPAPPFKAKPSPNFKSAPTPRQKAMEAISLDNKKRQADFYADPRCQPFRLRSLERPTNIEEIREEVERRRSLENEYIPAKVSKCPDPPSNEVKLNVAAVLREHALYQKQIDADRRRVEAFETELRDDSSFKAWQDEERARLEMGEALELQFRRESVAAIGQAINEAKQAMIREKQELAEDVRQEGQKLSARREGFQMEMDLFNKLRHENVLQERVALKEAVNKLAEERKSKAMEIQEKSNEFSAELAQLRAMELKIKQELVRQLRALELEASRTVKKFDPNTTAGHGLMEEMSITELRERLAFVKQALRSEREARRATITAHKEERRNSLLEKSLFVKKMREVTRIQQVSKRETKKKNRPATASFASTNSYRSTEILSA